MSEKRFIFATNEKWFLFDNETEDYLDMEDCKDKLNEQQATISALKEENEQLKEELKDANDEIGYWKNVVEGYRNSAKLDLDECTIIQKDKKYVGKIKTFVKYENEISIDLCDLKEAKVVEDE